jgi:hypothetical protein
MSLCCCLGEEENRRRRNGFESPWHPLQALTWFLFLALVLEYFAFLMPLLWHANYAYELLTLGFCITLGGAMLGAYMTCSVDPIDEALTGVTVAREEQHLYCYICESLQLNAAGGVFIAHLRALQVRRTCTRAPSTVDTATSAYCALTTTANGTLRSSH